MAMFGCEIPMDNGMVAFGLAFRLTPLGADGIDSITQEAPMVISFSCRIVVSSTRPAVPARALHDKRRPMFRHKLHWKNCHAGKKAGGLAPCR